MDWGRAHLGYRKLDAFENTLGNARMGALTRVFVDVPETEAPTLASLRKTMEAPSHRFGRRTTAPWTDSELLAWIQDLPRRKRVRYLEAFEELKTVPFNNKDAQVTTFVKLEMTEKKEGKFYKPRLIQYRTARYLVHIARYLKPIEHAVYASKGIWCKDTIADCAKSHSVKQRSSIAVRKAQSLRSPVALSLDCSAFDAHINVDLLKVEHKFYQHVGKSAGWNSSELGQMARALKLQLHNQVRGTFSDGSIKYTVSGNRMSGDLNTALGNVVLMSGMMRDAMLALVGPDGWTLYDDGDDCQLWVEEELLAVVTEGLPKRFLGYGMTLKIEEMSKLVTDSGLRHEGVLFCQHRLVDVSGVWTFVRDPLKCVSNGLSGPLWQGKGDEDYRGYLYAVGYGDGLSTLGVPILQTFHQWMRTAGKYSQSVTDQVVLGTWRMQNIDWSEKLEPTEILWSTRESFFRAWGISPLDQVRYEEDIMRMPLDFDWADVRQ